MELSIISLVDGITWIVMKQPAGSDVSNRMNEDV